MSNNDPFHGFKKISIDKPGLTPAAAGALARGDMKNFVAASTPGGIEAQEKQGQEEQAVKETLPVQMSGCTKSDFEKLGFKFHEKTDKIFWKCTFPKGWTKKPTGHSMWTDLLDDKGRKRGSIFFKAAFYDYDAHIGLNIRYVVKGISLDTKKEEIFNRKTGDYKEGKRGVADGFIRYEVIDTATGTTLYSGVEVDRKNYTGQDEVKKISQDWLTQKFPDWNNPAAYWD